MGLEGIKTSSLGGDNSINSADGADDTDATRRYLIEPGSQPRVMTCPSHWARKLNGLGTGGSALLINTQIVMSHPIVARRGCNLSAVTPRYPSKHSGKLIGCNN
jgi:hypothetical protein